MYHFPDTHYDIMCFMVRVYVQGYRKYMKYIILIEILKSEFIRYIISALYVYFKNIS